VTWVYTCIIHRRLLGRWSAVNEAYSILGFLNRGIEYKSKEVKINLSGTLVRPQQEYCVQFWVPHYRNNVNVLERAKKRFFKMVPGMKMDWRG